MISFQNVSKIYRSGLAYESIALQDVNFSIEKGEFISFVGKSGAGKSTVVKLLIGEERPTKGRVLFSSYDVAKLASSELPAHRRRIGVIFQDFRLLANKTVLENVAFSLEVAGRLQSDIDDFVPQALELVGLKSKTYSFPKELSGGEKQRAAIARAVINHPDLLIADEPTGNLDPLNSKEILRILLKINELGTTVILATHAKDVVDYLHRRVVTLDEGRVIKDVVKGRYMLV